jgi:hypothetical protein
MSPAASEALRKIWAIQKYPCPQTPHAIQKILKQLHVADYMAVVDALETEEGWLRTFLLSGKRRWWTGKAQQDIVGKPYDEIVRAARSVGCTAAWLGAPSVRTPSGIHEAILDGQLYWGLTASGQVLFHDGDTVPAEYTTSVPRD